VRKLDPFRRFLEVAAQCNGKIIHYENIAKDCGVDGKTVATYFNILEDTWLGMMLEPFHHSFRKRLSQKLKFYFYDVGMARALARTLTVLPNSGTSYYGELFEQLVVAEIAKLVSYYHSEYRLSYLQVRDGLEVDIVVERPGQKLLLIEIKSTKTMASDAVKSLNGIVDELNAEAVCLSQDPHEMRFDKVLALPWQEGLKRYFQGA
jgi:predicted AAA+ superfamily ATPase